MAYFLVIVQKPEELPAWASFESAAKIEELKTAEGVFCIDDNVWIFDTQRSLAVFALVTHQATKQHIQLHTFELYDDSSHVGSCPPATKLVEFLARVPLPK
jgi:hypothetical protein